MDEFLRAIPRLWPFAIVLVPGLWALYLRWSDGQRVHAAERGDLIKIAQDVSRDAIKTLREETDALRERVDELEAELAALQKRHTDMMADKDAKITLLEGEKRQLQMLVDAYADLLRRHDIPLPVQSQAYWVTPDRQIIPAEESPVERAKP